MKDKLSQTTVRQFSIVSPQRIDSMGSTDWETYLDPNRLMTAWELPEGSPYTEYQKFTTINALSTISESIKPRYSEGESHSQEVLQRLIRRGEANSETAIVLDSGGAHSVAMAVELARHGYQPISMFDNAPNVNGSNRSEQALATLVYFAREIESLKKQGIIRPDSPPVFIMDCHRNAPPINKTWVDNSYSYSRSDFPHGQILREHGINEIIYLNEANFDAEVNASLQLSTMLPDDLRETFQSWQKSGLNILYTGIAPWVPKDIEMSPEVYGESSGIAMHLNRKRYIFTKEGHLEVINQSGIARPMSKEQITTFKRMIEEQLLKFPENNAIKRLFHSFLDLIKA